MKVLFISPWPLEGGPSRYRFLQYFDYFESKEVKPVFSPFMSKGFFKIRRRFGLFVTVQKALYFTAASLKRFLELFFLFRYQVVVIHREAFPLGPPVFEKLISLINRRVVFDIDDASYATPSSGVDQRSLFRDKGKLGKVFSYSQCVIVGNDYLYSWGVTYNKNITIIPTCVFVNRYKIKTHSVKEEPVIGWIGNWGNAHYVSSIRQALAQLAARKKFILKLVGGMDIYDIRIKGVKIDYKLWDLKEEENDIFSFDIGIMPLLDTEFDRGKCGFKAIQYSAMAIPPVASAVGANTDIIENRVNGFLAYSMEDWVNYLEGLIQDSDLRNFIGRNARENVAKRFNSEKKQEEIFRIISNVANRGKNA